MRIGIDLRFLQSAYRNSNDGGLGGVGVYSKGLLQALAHCYPQHQYIGFVDHGDIPCGMLDLVKSTGCSDLRPFGAGKRFKKVARRLERSSYSWILRSFETEFSYGIGNCFDDLDIFHVLNQSPPPRLDCKTIVTVYDLIPFFPSYVKSLSALFTQMRLVYLKGMTRADALVCISKSTEKDLHQYLQVAEGKTRVIYPGINQNIFRNSKYEDENAGHENLFNQPYFLHVGVCEGRKNPGVLVKAIQLLANKTELPFSFVFVGPYQVKPQAMQFINDMAARLFISDKIVFIGDVSDEKLAALYRNSVSLVFPSTYEGFGYPPVEALACGGHCITSKNSSLPEAVSCFATLVDPFNQEDIAHAMLNQLMIYHEGNTPNLKGIAWAMNFSWDKAAAYYNSLYNELCS